MWAKKVTPNDYEEPYFSPRRIIIQRIKRLRAPSARKAPAEKFVEVIEVPPDKRSVTHSKEYVTRRRLFATTSFKPTCCEWGMIGGIILLSAGLLTTIVLLFTLPCNRSS